MFSVRLRMQLVLTPILPAILFAAMIKALDDYFAWSMSDRYWAISLHVAFWVVLPIAIALEVLGLKEAVSLLVRDRASRNAGAVLCAFIGTLFLASSAFIVSRLFWE
jgi:hypothetical protein